MPFTIFMKNAAPLNFNDKNPQLLMENDGIRLAKVFSAFVHFTPFKTVDVCGLLPQGGCDHVQINYIKSISKVLTELQSFI